VCFGGTVLSLAGTRVVHRLVDALDGVPDTEVTAVFTAADRSLVGDLPERIRVLEQVPLNLFLDGFDVLLHHGGSTTGLTGVRYGLPQLVLPQMFDQFDYGQRLAAAGAGITVDDAAGQSDVDGLRAAVLDLLDDPRYADAAGRLRAEMAAAPPVTALVPDLVALCEKRRHPTYGSDTERIST
jgi:UDP:flavonoid glycosyltransferase YjiC (YdhE family)